MKRNSRAHLLISMAINEGNNVQGDPRNSSPNESYSPPTDSSSYRPLQPPEYTVATFDDTFEMEQPSISLETVIDNIFQMEQPNTFLETVFDDTLVLEQPKSLSKMAAVAIDSPEDVMLRTNETVLSNLEQPQEFQVINFDIPRAVISNDAREEVFTGHDTTSTEPNLHQIDIMQMPMTLHPGVISEGLNTHNSPLSASAPSLTVLNNRSSDLDIRISNTSSSRGPFLNPETGLFEEELQEEETINTQSNDIISIKNKRKYNQVLRLHGKEYHGLMRAEGTVIQTKKSQRQLKAVPCNHGTVSVSGRSFLCGSVQNQARKDIFNYFWSLSSWEAKKAYVLGSVAIRDVIKRRKTTENGITKRKSAGVDCCLPRGDGIKVRVCRDLFLATLDITKDTFTDWTKAKGCHTDDTTQCAPTIRDENANPNKRTLKSDSVMAWLDQLAKVPSHYCRSSTSRTYVDDAFQSQKRMHDVYVSWCESNSLEFVQRKKFCEILESKKISIYKPRKDQCDTCVSYKEGNLNEEAYRTHLSKKNEAREAKKRAIESLSNEHFVCTMDLQSVQLCPKLLVSSQYYKQKLQLHVFTIYINNTKDVFLFVWHEGDGGVTANEFVTCIVTFIQVYATKGYKKITLISDGCGYQNRNKVLSSALADVSRLQSIEILQIILEKGHTMMEVDSVHSTLEKCFTAPLYSPADYVTRMQKARPSQPYIIRHVDHTFFKNFEAVPSNFASIRPGRKAGDPTVADIRSLAYRNGESYYKIRHDETEWTLLPQRRKSDLYEEARCLYTLPRRIEKSKFDSLQSLKPFMHRDYHPFYDNLSS